MDNHVKLTLLVTVFAIYLCSCSDNDNQTDIPLSEVPANIITIIQNTLPGITLDKAEKHVDDDKFIYELEGTRINNNEYEIKITEGGTIQKIELED